MELNSILRTLEEGGRKKAYFPSMSDPFVFPFGAEIAERRNRDCFPEESLAANRIKQFEHKRALARRHFYFFGVSPSLKKVWKIAVYYRQNNKD
ncbi:hypothetical protein CDAR_601551 [Caerostris darwini]|uniref:Uncharacterized protein n=1 Tax=Caerostris darwini TaxID=1538125 RepID=A0AAV4N285_9ARAC|nr:hypothetical protein CDAR_601551 [Caerostris darwini]